jgi:predicted phage terminase large subunit-like protein
VTEHRTIKPHPGPQERFLASRAFEAGYGGQAGGGKSFALVLGSLRFTCLPNYAGLLLRRTVPDLKKADGLLDLAAQIFPCVGGQPHEGGVKWTFPTATGLTREERARVDLSSLDHEQDKLKYQGSSYQYIGFDELTQFTKTQYQYLFSRARSAHGVPLAVRWSSNPGGPGHDWVLERFAPWLYPPPDPENPYAHPEFEGPYALLGEKLYYRYDEAQQTSVLVDPSWWHPTCDRCAPGASCPDHLPRSRTFFPAALEDNPSLAGTGYGAALDELDPLTRAQLKHGNWMARAAAGAYFQRVWIKVLPAVPADVVGRVRYWDRAATAGDGDFTAGPRVSRTREGLFVVEDMRRGQWDPGKVEQMIRQTILLDPRGTRTVLEKDPGAAGKFEANYYARELAGHDIHTVPPQGDKQTRAKPVSAQAEAGNLAIVAGPWNEAFLRELESFPVGHDDQVDGLSGAFAQLIRISGGKSTSSGVVRELSKKAGGF